MRMSSDAGEWMRMSSDAGEWMRMCHVIIIIHEKLQVRWDLSGK
jgi:hypothetical protein